MAMKMNFTSVITINLLAFLFLSLWYPHLMISPGKLIEGHQELTTDCFACHIPFRGSSPQKCITCHQVDKIGLFSTKGVKLLTQKENVSFHQDLIEQDCVACHSDHRGVSVYRAIRRFSHELLAQNAQEQCHDCHQTPPKDALHWETAANCDKCHSQISWEPASFDHRWLSKATQAKCASCHPAPTDALHRKIVGNCDKCHTQDKWKPATFEHNKYFQLDSNHDVACVKCHLRNDYGNYTCYQCHEHSFNKIRAEHVEEGIYDYKNCTECHRSADKEEAEGRWEGRQGGEREDEEEEDD